MHSFPEHPESADPEDISTVLTTLSKTTQREGLPAGFRMRADSHYVDALDAPAAPSIRLVAIDSIEGEIEPVDPQAIQQLADSIKRHGLLQPVLVQSGRRASGYRLIEGRRRMAAARLAGLKQIPCIVHAVDDATAGELQAAARRQVVDAAAGVASADGEPEKTAAAGRELHDALMGIISSLPFLSNRSAATRGVAAQAISQEAHRALSLLTAVRVLRDEIVFTRTAVSARNVVEQVSAGASGRVFSAGRDVRARGAADAVIIANEELLLAAMNGAAAAFSLLSDGHAAAPVEVTAGHDPDSRSVTFVVRQPGLTIPAGWARQAFDEAWPTSGGPAALVLMRAVRHVATLHGGYASVAIEHGSTTASIRIPAGPDA